MKAYSILLTALLFLAAFLCRAAPGSLRPSLNMSWSSFLSRHDLVFQWSAGGFWDSFYSGAWGGNGCLGFVMFARSAQLLTLVVSRVDIYDDRNPSMASFMNNFVYDQPRLPIGDLELWFEHTATGVNLTIARGTMRTVLYNGSSLGVVTLENPSAPNASCEMLMTIIVSPHDDEAPSDEETLAGFIALKLSPSSLSQANPWCAGISPRFSLQPHLARSTWWPQDASYVENPPPVLSTSPCTPRNASFSECTMTTSLQLHLNGTAHATGLAVDASMMTAFLTISGVVRNSALAQVFVQNSLYRALSAGFEALCSATADSWRNYWESSGGFLTMHDSLFEGFYFIQLYKFRSAVRPNGTVHDLQGPWFFYGTDWPDLHWDMNLQQAYFLVMTGSDRLKLGKTFVDFLVNLETSGQLRRNTRPEWEYAAGAPSGASSLEGMTSCYWDHAPDCLVEPPTITGNLLWAAHVLELYANYSDDCEFVVRENLWPVLTGALSSYQYFQVVDNVTGEIHLPPTFSPEYPGPRGPDCNYDVSLYRWGLQRAIVYASRYNLTHPLLPNFKSTFDHLTLMPIDSSTESLDVYRGIPFTIPHRHYSHLFSVWPLHIGDLRDDWWRGVAERSVDIWLNDPASDSEFFRPVASKMSTILDRPAAAYGNISTLINNFFFVHSNTFYGESGGPCTETPYAAAWAISELLLQSWNSSLDFFPAVPDVIVKKNQQGPRDHDQSQEQTETSASSLLDDAGLADSAFYRIRCMGGYLASAARKVIANNATHVVSTPTFLTIERISGRQGDHAVIIRTTMERPLHALNCDDQTKRLKIIETGGGYISVEVSDAISCFAVLPASDPVPLFLSVSPSSGNETFFNFWGFPDRRI
jgi:hypothetical protein